MILNHTPVRILAIDPGFDRLGVAVIDKKNDKEELVYSTCIITKRSDAFHDRLFMIGTVLEKIIQDYTPNHMAIEKLFLSNNQKTVMGVAEVRGVCLFFGKKYGLDIYEYSPPEIKVAVTGYGRSTKEDISYMVYKIIKMPSKIKLIDDEIDAIAIGLTHSATVKLHTLR